MSQDNPIWNTVFAPVLLQSPTKSSRGFQFCPAIIARRVDPNAGPHNPDASLRLPSGNLDQNNK
jgi:hypothetical protein